MRLVLSTNKPILNKHNMKTTKNYKLIKKVCKPDKKPYVIHGTEYDLELTEEELIEKEIFESYMYKKMNK
jgi:hypothetical protein